MNGFQVARGYSMSILGILNRVVTQEILYPHVDRDSIRSVENNMHLKDSRSIYLMQNPTGTAVFVYYRSSKDNRYNQCIPSVVGESH